MASTTNNFVNDHDVYDISELRQRNKPPNKIIDINDHYKYRVAKDSGQAFVIVLFMALSLFIIAAFCKFLSNFIL